MGLSIETVLERHQLLLQRIRRLPHPGGLRRRLERHRGPPQPSPRPCDRELVPSLVSGTSQSNQTAPGEAYPLTDLQSVYNATSLYSKGDNGAGYTVGILDFYGDPTSPQQLQYFDQLYDLPSAPLNVIPIDAYDPSLGTAEGWAPRSAWTWSPPTRWPPGLPSTSTSPTERSRSLPRSRP